MSTLNQCRTYERLRQAFSLAVMEAASALQFADQDDWKLAADDCAKSLKLVKIMKWLCEAADAKDKQHRATQRGKKKGKRK